MNEDIKQLKEEKAKLVEALRGFVDWSDSQEWRRPGKVLGQRVENARTLLAQLDGELE